MADAADDGIICSYWAKPSYFRPQMWALCLGCRHNGGVRDLW